LDEDVSGLIELLHIRAMSPESHGSVSVARSQSTEALLVSGSDHPQLKRYASITRETASLDRHTKSLPVPVPSYEKCDHLVLDALPRADLFPNLRIRPEVVTIDSIRDHGHRDTGVMVLDLSTNAIRDGGQEP
jgi:hypothetical protein